MNIIEALRLCRSGHKVRPVCWRGGNPGQWVEVRGPASAPFFVEHGTTQEIPHALRLAIPDEFLGEWETLELLPDRRVKPC